MKKVVTYGDLWILSNIFQKFSIWSQKTFGLTNFWWTRFFMTIAFIIGTVDNLLTFKIDAYAWIIFLLFILQFLLLWLFLSINELCIMLDKKYSSGYKYINDMVETLFVQRITCGVLGCWIFISFLTDIVTTGSFNRKILLVIVLVLVPICLYFISCTPLPPGQSKVSKWIDGVKNKMQQVFSPEPSLAPSRC